jgi:hypothetical protein
MKHLRIYEEFETETNDLIHSVSEYLIAEYPSDWWESEFQNKLPEYITEEDCIGYGTEEEPDYESDEEAYKELCTGGAIEYDLIDEIYKDIKDKFNLTEEECDKIHIFKLIEKHMCNMIDWYDHGIFGENKIDVSDPLGMKKNIKDMMSHFDKYDDIKF